MLRLLLATVAAVAVLAVAATSPSADPRPYFVATVPGGQSCESGHFQEPCPATLTCPAPCQITFKSPNADPGEQRRWDVTGPSGRQATGSGPTFSYTFAQGRYQVGLTVTGPDGIGQETFMTLDIRDPADLPAAIGYAGPAALHLPATFELVSPKRNLAFLDWYTHTQSSPNSISGPAQLLRRRGPDAGGLYHYVVRIDQAPRGRINLDVHAWSVNEAYADTQTVSLQVTSNSLPALRIRSVSGSEFADRRKGTAYIRGTGAFVATVAPRGKLEVRFERRGASGGGWSVYRQQTARLPDSPNYAPEVVQSTMLIACGNIGQMLHVGYHLRMVTRLTLDRRGRVSRQIVKPLVACAKAPRPPRNGF